jgi:hypothetical protein
MKLNVGCKDKTRYKSARASNDHTQKETRVKNGNYRFTRVYLKNVR